MCALAAKHTRMCTQVAVRGVCCAVHGVYVSARTHRTTVVVGVALARAVLRQWRARAQAFTIKPWPLRSDQVLSAVRRRLAGCAVAHAAQRSA
jgi:hypothetical protein